MDPVALKPWIDMVGLPSALFLGLIVMLWKRRTVSPSDGATMERLASVLREVETLSRIVAGNHEEVRHYFQAAENVAGNRHSDLKLHVVTSIQEWKDRKVS